MLKLIKIELYKIFKKPRTYIGFGAIAFIVIVIQLAFAFEGQKILGFITQGMKDKFIFEGNLINYNTVTYIIFNSLWIHLPMLVSLVAGDLIAGESNAGTFRLILTRPISRTKLLTSKLIAGWTYSMALIIFMALLSLGLGQLIFSGGDLIVIREKINIFAVEDILWRFALAYVYAMLTMTVITSLAFLLSAFSDNSVGPIVGTFAIIIVISIISTIGFSIFEPILPYIFTTRLPNWNLFFEMNVDWREVSEAIWVNIVYIFIFITTTIVYFRKKDILS